MSEHAESAQMPCGHEYEALACTRDSGHAGTHRAHGMSGGLLGEWPTAEQRAAAEEWRDRIGVRVLTGMTCAHVFDGAVCEICWGNAQRICALIEREHDKALTEAERRIAEAQRATAERGYEGAGYVYGAAAQIVRELRYRPGTTTP